MCLLQVETALNADSAGDDGLAGPVSPKRCGDFYDDDDGGEGEGSGGEGGEGGEGEGGGGGGPSSSSCSALVVAAVGAKRARDSAPVALIASSGGTVGGTLALAAPPAGCSLLGLIDDD